MAKSFQLQVISYESAAEAVQVAVIEGEKLGVSVSVAIVDPSLSLVAFGKADGATPHSVETSRRKAITGASTKKPSGWMDSELALSLPLAANNLLTNVPGGFPIKDGEVVIGGLGIAGGTVEQDAAIAKATLAKLSTNEQ